MNFVVNNKRNIQIDHTQETIYHSGDNGVVLNNEKGRGQNH